MVGQRRRENDADAAQAALEESRQASKIGAWVAGSICNQHHDEKGRLAINLVNASDQPVYKGLCNPGCSGSVSLAGASVAG